VDKSKIARPWKAGKTIHRISLFGLLFYSIIVLVYCLFLIPPDLERNIRLITIFVQLVGFLFLSLFCIFSKLTQARISKIDKTRQTFETVLDTTPGYMVIINENAGVEYISASLAQWLGISQRRYAQGRPFLDLFRSGEMKMIFQEIMEQNGYVDKNFEATVDGKKYWFMLRSSLLEKDKFARYFEWVDISSIMEAMNAAESAARAKSDFLANISHEIRTPMNAIIGMTDLMLVNPLEPEQMTRADTIKGAALSLLNIINDILDFSKIDARKMEIIPQSFYFSSFINDTVNMVNLKAAAAGLAFTTYISKNIPPLINTDELRLKQCLVNILNNAVKFTHKGYIHLRAWPEFQEDGSLKLCFSVRDTGMGIKKEDMGKLFNEFQRLDTRKNRNIIGTGLGLAITRRLLELMGGTVSVDSVYGEGSTFSFYVLCQGPHQGKLAGVEHPENLRILCFEPRPYNARALRNMLESLGAPNDVCIDIERTRTLLQAGSYTHIFLDSSGKEDLVEFLGRPDISFIILKEVSEKYDNLIPNSLNRPILISALSDVLNGKKNYQRRLESVQGTHRSFTTRGANILVVDDNPVNLTVAKGLLSRYNVAAETAAGGEEAIEKIKRTEYDIVFMDHMMPGMDGLDTTRAIRALGGAYAQVTIIALTANAVSGVREQFLEAGMDDFLSKPVIIKELQELLLKHLPPEKIIHTKAES
jgi:signal transduction histidine kinase/CheY-like chemotaxis protein